jgi:hypothetical protein
VGKALLSRFPEEALERFLAVKGLPRRTANTITDPAAFREHLRTVRRQGYAVDDEENEKGIRCLGAPIFDGTGSPVAAISVSGPVFQMTRKYIQDVVKREVMEAAAEISRRLGSRDDLPEGECPMGRKIVMDEDRLFPRDPAVRGIARRLYGEVKRLPIVSPHGHTDPRWYADNDPFPDPASLFLIPDHYLLRMLYSQGVPLEKLGVPRTDGAPVEKDPRKIWRLFAEHYHLFRGTPSRMWFEQVLFFLFGVDRRLDPSSADGIYDRIEEALQRPEFRPRALYERFNIEAIATTDSPLDSLEHHRRIASSGWKGKVVPAFRPDPVTDPDFPGFRSNVARLAEISGEDTGSWEGYLRALAERRRFFQTLGATSTDHGHPAPPPRTSTFPPAVSFSPRPWPARFRPRKPSSSGARS